VYVALVCPYDLRRPGGVRSHIVGLGGALTERGHRVDVIAPSATERIDSLDVIECGRSRGITFGGTQIDLTWAEWSRVATVTARGYDVMHFHTIWNPLVPFQLAAGFRGPKVATFHDVPGRATPRLAAAMMGPMSELLRRLWLRRVIAVSPAVGSYLSDGRYQVIPNGITVPAPLPAEGERRGLLYVGRLEPRKDVATLLRAVALLGDAAPPLTIAGDGYLRPDLERLAGSLGLRKVTFMGEVNETDKWRLLRDAAVLIAPSITGESFGIVLLEALAAGAIPIAADNPGYRDVLRDRRDDLLYRAGDAEALAQRIRAVMASDALRQSLRAWGDATWPAYDWRQLAVQVERVYRDAIGSEQEHSAPG